jgi:hypothetical protein
MRKTEAKLSQSERLCAVRDCSPERSIWRRLKRKSRVSDLIRLRRFVGGQEFESLRARHTRSVLGTTVPIFVTLDQIGNHLIRSRNADLLGPDADFCNKTARPLAPEGQRQLSPTVTGSRRPLLDWLRTGVRFVQSSSLGTGRREPSSGRDGAARRGDGHRQCPCGV